MAFPNIATQFKPGNCANPNGRPKGPSLTTRLRELLEKNTINGKPIEDGQQVADLLASVIINMALKGDFRFVDLVINRVDGKVRDEVTVNGNDGTTEFIRSYLLRKNDEADSAS